MYQKQVTIINRSGLHARPAASFVKLAGMFRSDVSILHNGQKINAKSILNVLAAGIIKGSEVIIQAEGQDEFLAVETLYNMLEAGVGE